MCGPTMEKWSYTKEHVLEAMESGMLDEAVVNSSAVRVLKQKIEAGLFETPLTDESLVASLNSDADQALARGAAQSGIDLLLNDGILPLKQQQTDGKFISVIGPLGSCDEAVSSDKRFYW